MTREALIMTRALLLALVMLFVTRVPGFADGGRIRGFAEDHRGTGLYGARVRLIGSGGTFQTTADRDGFFVFLSVPPGTYEIYALEDGYLPGCQLGVVVEPDEVRDVTIRAFVRGTVILPCRRALDLPLLDPDATADVYDVH